MFPPPPGVQPQAPTSSSEVSGGGAEAAVVAPASSTPLISAESEETFLVELGQPGAAGHYLALFSNRGGRLLSLKLGDVYTQGELTPEQQEDPAYFVEILRANGQVDGWNTASFGLVAGPSSK